MSKPSPSIVLTPKTTFLADKPRVAQHNDLMASPAFHSAASAALLEYQYFVSSGEVGSAAVSALKLRGAQEFLRTLMNLGLPVTPAQTGTEHALTPPEEVLRRGAHLEPPTTLG